MFLFYFVLYSGTAYGSQEKSVAGFISKTSGNQPFLPEGLMIFLSQLKKGNCHIENLSIIFVRFFFGAWQSSKMKVVVNVFFSMTWLTVCVMYLKWIPRFVTATLVANHNPFLSVPSTYWAFIATAFPFIRPLLISHHHFFIVVLCKNVWLLTI